MDSEVGWFVESVESVLKELLEAAGADILNGGQAARVRIFSRNDPLRCWYVPEAIRSVGSSIEKAEAHPVIAEWLPSLIAEVESKGGRLEWSETGQPRIFPTKQSKAIKDQQRQRLGKTANRVIRCFQRGMTDHDEISIEAETTVENVRQIKSRYVEKCVAKRDST